jgi:hypothetical protein
MFIIKTTPDSSGSCWGITQEGETFAVALFHRPLSTRELFKSEHRTLKSAVERLVEDARRSNLTLDLEGLTLPAGELILLQTETRSAAREIVSVFRTQADYDAYRRAQLSLYPEGYEDAAEIAKLLEAGDVDAAWDLATADDDDSKSLWDTDFGSHYTSRERLELSFRDLPEWFRELVTIVASPNPSN